MPTRIVVVCLFFLCAYILCIFLFRWIDHGLHPVHFVSIATGQPFSGFLMHLVYMCTKKKQIYIYIYISEIQNQTTSKGLSVF